MSIKSRVQELVALVEQGQITEALQRYYASDVAMQENLASPVVGREVNIERERAFFGGITLHENRARSVVVDGDRAVIHWLLDFTAGDGRRYTLDQFAIQEWQDGRVVRERFVYDSATIAKN